VIHAPSTEGTELIEGIVRPTRRRMTSVDSGALAWRALKSRLNIRDHRDATGH